MSRSPLKGLVENKWTGVAVKVLAVSVSIGLSFNFGKTYEQRTTNQVVARSDSLEAAVGELLGILAAEGRIDTITVARVDTVLVPGDPILVPAPPETTIVLNRYAIVDTVTVRRSVIDTIKVEPEPDLGPPWLKDPRRRRGAFVRL